MGGARTRVRVAREADQVEVTSVDDVLHLAAQMTAKERQELLDQLGLQNQLASKSVMNPDLEMWSGAVLTALNDAIGLGGGENYGVMLLKRLLGSSSTWRPVEQYMLSSGLSELNRNTRLSVYLLFARLLVEECRDLASVVGAPLSAKFVANRTGDLAGVVDRAFPGYAAAGLMPMVANRMARGEMV
jgi:hypothetical protein